MTDQELLNKATAGLATPEQDAPKPTIQVTVPITLERVSDLLCCAFEGGSGYWARIIDYRVPDNPRSVSGEETVYKHLDYPLTGGAVIVEDSDGGVHTLDRTAIAQGLNLLATLYPEHWGNFLGENEDAETGDVFLQCCLLGILVYG